MKLKFLLNIFVALIVYNAITFYIGWNGWVWLQTFTTWGTPYLYSLIMIFIAYSYFLGRFGPQFSMFKIIGAYWMALIQYSLMLLPIADLAVILLRYGSFEKGASIFWVGSITLIAFGIIFAYGSFNAYSPIIRTYKIKLDKKSSNLTKLRIAMASDMHFGTLSGKAHLQRLVNKVNALQSDLILLPGDIIDDEPGPFIRKNMGDIMKQMTAPLGVYGVLGNHEYYGGKIPEFLQQMKKIDIHILMDEIITIGDDLVIVGRKDRTDKMRQPLEKLLEDVDRNLPLIVMDHQPYELDKAEQNGVDLMLSGHTHRGQMAPNHLITRKLYELDWGYLQKNNSHFVVSSGFGFWGPPLRIGSRSEIIQIEIEFE